ncbi:CCR4-Not complex component, Not1-domain-containing protein [Lobosporangium transversale]|uniref:General negative regulator of transcription subunit 1 n=1 Tax=Lobosporangium transversale TaxID=64571 RepID=A0A1Y2GDB7_9FUNG|nr:CCR4-Not complex component, Not1-domain-containing protein [Lobosporangium transversale]ORZ06742.1 CCR4-Not complex component, Not1-domain-containing protein [Lobosporangium transversale]|eukprot:XP_021877663.1 CCR4-Not complex component, Not1-domain-containing protein [Lobosporangium transversale]
MSSEDKQPNSSQPTTPASSRLSLPSKKSSFLTIVKAQVKVLLSTLSENTYTRSVTEIHSLIEDNGKPVYLHFIRLIVQAWQSGQGSQSSNYSGAPIHRLLIDQVQVLAKTQTSATYFCEAVSTTEKSEALKNFDFELFIKDLPLKPIEKIRLAIALLQSPKSELVAQAERIIQSTASALKEQLTSADQLLEFVQSLDASNYKSWDEPRDPVTGLINTLYNNNIPSVVTNTIKEIRDMNDNSESAALAKVMCEAGPSCCKSVSSVNDILRQAGYDNSRTPDEQDIARVLGMMVSRQSKAGSESAWDFKNVATALNKNTVDWVKVIQALDYPEFKISDVSGLEFIINSFRSADKNGRLFPLEAFWGQWSNVEGQISILKALVAAPTKLLEQEWAASSRTFTRDQFAQSSAEVQAHASAELESSVWNCIPLVETVMTLADNEVHDPLLDMGLKSNTELLFLGLVQLKTPWSSLHQDVVSKLLHVYLTGVGIIPQFVQTRLWQVNQGLFVSGLLDLYDHDRSSLPKILKLTEDLSILNKVLEVKSFMFAIDLAVLASSRNLLALDKWLQNRIAAGQDIFVRACLDYLSERIVNDARQSTPANKELPVETITIFLQVLLGSSISPENSAVLKNVHNACLQLHPQLANVAPAVEGGVTGNETSFSDDVEEANNDYYKRIYRGEISIPEIVDLLQQFKNSSDPREQDIYACMIHNLFDEYRFFPTYRERELAITSDLFGALIQHQLVSYIPLGIALRYVLDALRNPPGSKMFNFGAQALSRFQSRLQEWPTYCSHLLQIPHLQQVHPEIVRYIHAVLPSATAASQDGSGLSSDLTTSSPQQPINQEVQRQISQPTPASTIVPQPAAPPVFTSLNVDTLLIGRDDIDYEAPNEQTQDKILFIVNNVSQSNLEVKLAEMKELLRESAYRWFSNYIVVKRASIEPNYHVLYLQFLDGLQSPLLYRHILHETYANIKILINSEKTVQSSSDRTLLKNLGSWLGGMTLARNRPIKHKNLAFKELLIEGYDSNRLIVAIPFVCKVLEQCNKSKVFKPPNPWLVAIMRLLVELYQFADLKLHLKFEIEVLCNRQAPQELVAHPATLTQDFERLSMGGYAPSARMPVQAAVPSTVATSQQDASMEMVPNLAAFVTFNPPAFYNERPALKRLVHIAIDRAVREIVAPVVDRSVTIAGISTREMIIKDFAMEPNEEKMRKAAHLMVQNLAGSLALVTCKEPLRVSMANIIRTLFLQNGFTDQNMPEQSILMTVNDNLDLACSVIEKAAMEKAIPEIEESLANAFNARKKHRERTGQPYYDVATYQSSRYPASLPEPLRIKPTGLSAQQLRVYEDFARLPRQAAMAPVFDTDRSVRTPLNARADAGQAFPFNTNELSYNNAPIPLSAHQALEKFAQIISELDKLISLSPSMPLAALPPNHEVKMLARLVPLIPAQSFSPDEMALTFSQKIVQLLYKTDQVLSRDVYAVLLEQLCALSSKVAKEVTEWLIYADDERKFNVPVTVTLTKAGLVSLVDQDIQLARLIEIGRPGIVEYAIKLIRECVLSEQPCASRNEFINSLNVLNRLAQRGGKTVEPIVLLIEDIRRRALAPREAAKDIDNSVLREQLAFIFAEWIRVYQLPTSNDKDYGAFINSIQQQGVLKGEEISSLFFRVCTEMSVESYIKYKVTNTTAAYQGVDAFVKLIVTLVKHYSDPQGVNHSGAKVTYLTTLLSIIVLVLAQAHEQRRGQFNQKPFLRLFSGLLTEMMTSYESSPGMYFQILTAFSNTFHTLQPLVFPGFTYGWLSLISHRAFMPKLLLAENGKGWASFQKLLVCLFRFLIPFLVGGEMRDTTRALYKGTLRVLLVLLHDFPEFLCDYHFSFCDVIPHTCIQLRNLILSAFPRNMRLPDPFTPNLKVDLLAEIHQPPRVLSDYTSSLSVSMKSDVDTYLRTREHAAFLDNWQEILALDPNNQDLFSGGSKYNVPMINSLVLYVGVNGIAQLHASKSEDNGNSSSSSKDIGDANANRSSSSSSSQIAQTASMDIFQKLLTELDSEGRYLFLSAIANQLRYPNSHTHYFSRATQEKIKEQITRVLLERLIVNRPHPWGLLITFIELIKNPRYAFWDHAFTRIDPDIEKLFDSVSRSVKRSA